MIIKNARVYGEDFLFHEKDLFIAGDRIVSRETYDSLAEEERTPGEAAFVLDYDPETCSLMPLTGCGDRKKLSDSDPTGKDVVIDAAGRKVIPGLVDIHLHGAAGQDICEADAEGIRKLAEFETSHGVAAFCAATMTLQEEQLGRVMETTARYAETAGGTGLVGINMEGPFISPEKTEAQDPDWILPADMGLFRSLYEKSRGLIKLVDIAPETEGAAAFIQDCKEHFGDKVRISLAHTCCSYDCAMQAFEAGADQLTHLFNAMPGIHHREPGPVIAAMEKQADVELIADGVHVHPAMIRFAFQSFGAEHILLISDSMEAAGLPDGTYELGGQSVTKSGRKAILTGKPDVIAGSVTNLFDGMLYAVHEAGIPLEEAVRAASSNPARAIGISEDYGSLEPGHRACVIIL